MPPYQRTIKGCRYRLNLVDLVSKDAVAVPMGTVAVLRGTITISTDTVIAPRSAVTLPKPSVTVSRGAVAVSRSVVTLSKGAFRRAFYCLGDWINFGVLYIYV